MIRQAFALVGIVAMLAANHAQAQEPRRESPPGGAGVRPLDESAPRPAGQSGGQRRPGDLRGRGGQLPPLDEPPGGRGPDEPGRGSGRRPMSPEMRGGLRGYPPGPGMGPPPYEMQRLEQDDPEMYQLLVEDNRLDREALALARRVREAKSTEREKLRADLAVVVNKHFDVRQQRRELSLKRMEEELKRLREAIESRSKGREDVVQRRITELVGDDKDLEF